MPRTNIVFTSFESVSPLQALEHKIVRVKSNFSGLITMAHTYYLYSVSILPIAIRCLPFSLPLSSKTRPRSFFLPLSKYGFHQQHKNIANKNFIFLFMNASMPIFVQYGLCNIWRVIFNIANGEFYTFTRASAAQFLFYFQRPRY